MKCFKAIDTGECRASYIQNIFGPFLTLFFLLMRSNLVLNMIDYTYKLACFDLKFYVVKRYFAFSLPHFWLQLSLFPWKLLDYNLNATQYHLTQQIWWFLAVNNKTLLWLSSLIQSWCILVLATNNKWGIREEQKPQLACTNVVSRKRRTEKIFKMKNKGK